MSPDSRRPSVLLVTSDPAPWGLAACYQRALVKAGCEVRNHLLVGEGALAMWAHVLMGRSKTLRRAIVHRARARLRVTAARLRPDLVMVVKGIELDADALAELKTVTGAVLVNIFPDSPLVYPGYPSLLGSAFSRTLGQYDCVFTFGRSFVPAFYACGARRVEHLPFAHDPEIHHPVEAALPEREHYRSPVAYLGTWGPAHERWLTLLAPFGLKIWGVQWSHLGRSSVLRGCWQRPGPVADGMGPGMASVCAAADVVFNLVRAEHGCAHSMKTFEIPACGGFMVSNRTPEQLEYFEEDRCAVYFATAEELVDKVAFYLKHDGPRVEIAERGLKEARRHTYGERLERVLAVYRDAGRP